MLSSTSFMDMIKGNKTNRGKLTTINTKKKSTSCELVFSTDIVDVAMNGKRLYVFFK